MNRSLFKRVGTLISMAMLVAACGTTSEQPRQNRDKTVLTGSYIPQDVQRNGQWYNGTDNVRTLDQTEIQNSGAATPRELLRSQGVAP